MGFSSTKDKTSFWVLSIEMHAKFLISEITQIGTLVEHKQSMYWLCELDGF